MTRKDGPTIDYNHWMVELNAIAWKNPKGSGNFLSFVWVKIIILKSWLDENEGRPFVLKPICVSVS